MRITLIAALILTAASITQAQSASSPGGGGVPDTFQRHQPELTTAQRTANSEQGLDELHKLADSHNTIKSRNDYTLFEAAVVVNNVSS